MSEESQYTALVPEYMERSRMHVASRYRDLISMVKRAFSDGVIDSNELAQIEIAEKDILLEYQIAADVFFKMNPQQSGYSAAQRLLNHLHRCNVLMRYARDQARLNYSRGVKSPGMIGGRDKRREDFAVQEEKVIRLGLKGMDTKTSVAAITLVKSLESPYERIRAELPKIRRNLKKLTPEERRELEDHIGMLIDQIQYDQLDHLSLIDMQRIMGLEKYLSNERELIRES